MADERFTPIEVAIALSLYYYNVSPGHRAEAIWRHFEGACMDPDDLFRICQDQGGHIATALPYPSAVVYISHALEKYGEEARERARIESGGPVAGLVK